MSNKSEKKQFTEKQISAQELHIQKIASRAFRNAYQIAIESGATVLVVTDGQLLKVSKTERVAIRSIEPYGTLKLGTHMKITKKRPHVQRYCPRGMQGCELCRVGPRPAMEVGFQETLGFPQL